MRNLSLVKKLWVFSFVAVCFALFNTNAKAQSLVVNYDFATASVTSTTPCVVAPKSTADNVTATLSTSTGNCATLTTGRATTVPPAFVVNAANQAVTLNGINTTAGGYYQLQLSGSGLSMASSYMVFFQVSASSTGPNTVALQYSTDGVNFTQFGSSFTPPTAFDAGFAFDLSSITALNNQTTVYFRIVGTGATGSTGVLRLDNLQVQALGPTAANATVGGRITDARGRGLRYVTIMMVGGGLEEPIYASTSAFGYYQFNDVPTGDTYVLSVFSRRYRFNQPSMVINVYNNFTDANFIGYQPFQEILR